MQHGHWRKGIIVGIIVLFIGTSFLPIVQSGSLVTSTNSGKEAPLIQQSTTQGQRVPVARVGNVTQYSTTRGQRVPQARAGIETQYGGGNDQGSPRPLSFPVHNLNKGTSYLTIQAAIDDASDGDAITVDSGTYAESIVTNKNLTLQGIDTGGGKPVLTGSGGGWYSYAGYFDRSITLRLFRIANPSGCGIQVRYGYNNIVGCTFDNAHVGLYFYGGAHFGVQGLVEFNEFGDAVDELNIYQGGVEIHDNTFWTETYSITLDHANGCVIYHNSIECQMWLSNSNYNQISHNTIKGDIYAVHLSDSSYNTIYDNYIYGSSTSNAFEEGNCHDNAWNISKELGQNIIGGPYLGGNYWGDYTGVDTSIPADGIGDTNKPYHTGMLTGGDYLPLTNNVQPPVLPVQNLNTSEGFSTIQAAIDDGDTQNGHIITVAAGTYIENLIIDKSISLLGEGQDTTFIQPDHEDDTVKITADNVVFSGFTVTDGIIHYAALSLLNVHGVTVTENTIPSGYSWYSIYITGSTGCHIYHNNLNYDSEMGEYDDSPVFANEWDNGYPSGGNYWYGYSFTDNYHGLNQNYLGADGISDYPYNVSGGGSIDHYPLVQQAPYTPVDLPIINITYPENGNLVYNPGGPIIITGTAYDLDSYVDSVIVKLYYTDGGINYYYGWSDANHEYGWYPDENIYQSASNVGGSGTVGDPLQWECMFGSSIFNYNSIYHVYAEAVDHDSPIPFSSADTNWFFYGEELTSMIVESPAGESTFNTGEGTFESYNWVNEYTLPQQAIDNKPTGLELPFGLFDFTITDLTFGSSVVLTIVLPDPVPVGSLWWKVNPNDNTWYSLPIGSDDGDNIVEITLYDGGVGDNDGTLDGVIHDPGGIGQAPEQPPIPIQYTKTIYVDASNTQGPWMGWRVYPYQTIQEGIDAANSGDTVFVKSGTYDVQTAGLTISASINLIGEDTSTTIIDGGGSATGITLSYTQNVYVQGFTIRNCDIGILIQSGGSEGDNTIFDNYITTCTSYGISIDSSSGNIICGNNIVGNSGTGLEITNVYGNIIYHNTFTSNSGGNAYDSGGGSTWYDSYPSGGNFWSDYIGSDSNGDGIGDTPYDVPGGMSQDNFPFMQPYTGVVKDTSTGLIYPTIQTAVDNANSGDTIMVYSGVYHENVVVSQQLYLVGEDAATTFIDGGGISNGGDAVTIMASGTTMQGFTIANSFMGIFLWASDITISDNVLLNTYDAVGVSADNNLVTHNTFMGNYAMPYSSGVAIGIEGSHNIIKNNTISNSPYGVYIWTGVGNNISGNVISNDPWFGMGIWLDALDATGDSNIVYENSIFGGQGGITLNYAQGTVISRNFYQVEFQNNYFGGAGMEGVFVYFGNYSTITDNRFYGGGLYVYDTCSGLTVENNMIDDRPILYLEDAQNEIIDQSQNAGQIILVRGQHVTIQNQDISGTYADCIQLRDCTDCTITDNMLSYGNFIGIDLFGSTNNLITNNTIPGDFYPIELQYSDSNTVSENTISYSFGLYIYSSQHNLFTKNTLTGNSNGIELWSSQYNTISENTILHNWHGIYFIHSSNNTITRNDITSSYINGIWFNAWSNSTYDNNNTITGNAITRSSAYGIRLESYTNGNLIYNNILNNTHNALDSGTNTWSIASITPGTNVILGPNLGGNYWSDYTGSDADHNGIGDTNTPYTTGITTGGDYYPLVPMPVTVDAATGGTATFNSSDGVFSALTGVSETSLPPEAQENKPAGLTLPFGLFNFTITGLIPGQTVMLTITLPGAVSNGSKWWKVNPNTNTWYNLSIGSDNGDNVITINLTDGGLGDNDGVADGTIHDPGGIGLQQGNEYTLTIITVGSGSVAKLPDQVRYHYGDVVQLTATANYGWSFSQWGGDLSGSTNPTTITIAGNASVTATFTLLPPSNAPPVILLIYPVNGSTGVSRPPAHLNATVADSDSIMLDVSIRWKNHTGTWVTLETYTGVGNGTYDFVPSGNDWIWGNTTYSWSVNVTDGASWTNQTDQYITRGSRYDVNNDNLVNFLDAGLVWVHRTSRVSYDGLYDMNQDGQVNFLDAGLAWIHRG